MTTYATGSVYSISSKELATIILASIEVAKGRILFIDYAFNFTISNGIGKLDIQIPESCLYETRYKDQRIEVSVSVEVAKGIAGLLTGLNPNGTVEVTLNEEEGYVITFMGYRLTGGVVSSKIAY